MIKRIYITEEGIKLCNELYIKLAPYIKVFNENINKEEQNLICNHLTKCRQLLEEIVKTRI